MQQITSCFKRYFALSTLSVIVWSFVSSPVAPPKTHIFPWKNVVAAPWTGKIWCISSHADVAPATNCQQLAFGLQNVSPPPQTITAPDGSYATDTLPRGSGKSGTPENLFQKRKLCEICLNLRYE